MDKDQLEKDLEQLVIHASPQNKRVTIESIPPVFQVIGIGTDAVVVSHREDPEKVIKVYAPERVHKKRKEWEVYKRLGNHANFTRCYGEGRNYLILAYEKGPTLYQCLEEGVPIPEQVIKEVDEARQYARKRGLNPRDIHLNNILLQDGHAKLLDVSEYVRPGNDRRWELLRWGYTYFYPLIRGKKVPKWLFLVVKNGYYQIRAVMRFLNKGWQLFKTKIRIFTKEKLSKGDS